MKTLAIANHKGGTGKTATSHALSDVLAANGWRVLMIDIDPQASLTSACGKRNVAPTIANVIGGTTPGALGLSDVTTPIDERLNLAPASIELATCELGLSARQGRERVLKKALASVAPAYHLCIIDCPPALGLLTVNALVAADAVLIPTQAQAADMQGVALFINTLNQIMAGLNPTLSILGVLVTFFDGRLNHHTDAVKAMRRAGLPLLSVMIGRSIRVAEAVSHHQAVTSYEPRNPQSENYRSLAAKVDKWLRENQT